MAPNSNSSTETPTALRTRIARAFARSASSYDQHASLQRQVADQLLIQLPRALAPAVVVDMGAGTGYCTALLQQRYPTAQLIALDLAEPMLRAVAQRCAIPAQPKERYGAAGGVAQAVQLLCADAQQLPLATAAVELLVSSLAVQWCDLKAVLRELARVLRPGGSAYLSTFGPSTLQELRAALRQVQPNYQANQFASADTIAHLARSVGLGLQLHSELVVRRYDSLLALQAELRGLGANTVLQASANPSLTPQRWQQLGQRFVAQGSSVSWELYYVVLQKPAL